MINTHVEIYDNIIDSETTNTLKQMIRQPEEIDISIIMLHRNPVIDRTKNIECKLGLFIHELLLQINDNTKYLEYWIHTDSKGIGFHRDCDDELLSNKNILLIPEKAHILYLDNDVYCPTMILNNNNTMLMSPNVSSRLTRFDGNLYHSVGIPGINFNNNTVIKKYNRNVILFNTWSEENFNSSTFTFSKNNFKYKNINKIECNNISKWKIIEPILNESSSYDYKLLFRFLREKRARKSENYSNYFTDIQLEKGILEFMMSSDIIEYYNKRLLTPLIIKFIFN